MFGMPTVGDHASYSTRPLKRHTYLTGLRLVGAAGAMNCVRNSFSQ